MWWQDLASGGLLDNSRKAIGWLNRSSSRATLNLISVYSSGAALSGALTFVNERRADCFGLPKGHSLGCARKAIVGNAWAGAVACVRALGGGCVAPNSAVNTRAEDRALKIKSRFRSLVRSVPDWPLSRRSSLARSCRPRIRLRA